MKGDARAESAERPMRKQMKGFAPTGESYVFSPKLLWSGCRATKSRRSQSESAKLSGTTGRSTWRLSTGLPAVFLEGLPVGLHRPHG